MSEQPNRLAADAAHGFGGAALDRSRPLSFRLNGHRIHGFAGDTVLSALLASGVIAAGTDGNDPIALDERFCPPVLPAGKRDETQIPFPMERMPAIDGADLITVAEEAPTRWRDRVRRRTLTGLGHRFDGAPLLRPWTRMPPTTAVAADLVIIGGGVAGLSAAEMAGAAGRKVILIERRPWLGGDARYFGAVGNDETPEAIVDRLMAKLATMTNVSIWTASEAYDIAGGAVIVHRVALVDGEARTQLIAIGCRNVILATGAIQRLPIFPGNRLPGVVGSAAAYHRAKRYGVWRGREAVFVTQSNFAYRLALRIHDAGVAINRIVDVRLNPHSRFVDFSKASGFTLSSELVPAAATNIDGALTLRVRGAGGAEQTISAASGQIVVSGGWQPELSLWMRASGAIRWNTGKGWLETSGQIAHVALAGSAAGCLTTKGAMASGRAAVAKVYGMAEIAVDDTGIDAMFETPDAPTPIAPPALGQAYLDFGASLIARRPPQTPGGDSARWSPIDDARPMSLGDVSASVQARLIEPADAGIIAEERGSAGGIILPSDWTVPVPPPVEGLPGFLAGRFGPDPIYAVVTVDNRRRFDTGALIYSNVEGEDPNLALGVVVGPAPGDRQGGTALLSRARLGKIDRFVIRTLAGPAPLRIAEVLKGPTPLKT